MSNIDRKAQAQKLERSAKQHRDVVTKALRNAAQNTSHYARLGFTYVRVFATGK